MSLKQQIQEDMKAAMRAKDTAKLGAIRLLMAAMKQREVDERIELDDPDIVMIVEKLIKQRKDSATQYEAGGRPELAQAERQEIEVLSAYQPTQLSSEEIQEIVKGAVSETGAKSAADMGKLMAVLKPRLAGRADMSVVSKVVKSALSSA